MTALRSTLTFALRLMGALVALLYLLNPTAGLFELIPDNLPIIGHLDEAAAMGLLITCVRGLRRARAPREKSAVKDHSSRPDTDDR